MERYIFDDDDDGDDNEDNDDEDDHDDDNDEHEDDFKRDDVYTNLLHCFTSNINSINCGENIR